MSHDDDIPDARDGLTRLERVILWQLREAQAERGGSPLRTAMLYGRVVEYVNVSVEEFQAVLSRLVGTRRSSSEGGRLIGPRAGP